MSSRPVVVVTGSSTGIGLQLCRALRARGYAVIATLRRPCAAPAALRASGCDVQPLDVTSDDSAAALRDYLRARYPRCDVLVNNAGCGLPGSLETCSIDAAKAVFDVNVWGVVRVTQLLVPLMRDAGGGLVLTVSSTSGWRGLPCQDVYVGSKHAVEGIMESFRYSVQKDNIKVCLVNPGPTVTPFINRYRAELVPGSRPCAELPSCPMRMTEHYIQVLDERIAAGQSAEDCAEAIANVVDVELPKNIDDGSTRATFWNPTSDYARYILENTRVFKDGASGPEYDALFKKSYEILDQLQKEEIP